MKVFLVIISLVISLNVSANDVITKVLNLSTEISKSKFFDYSVTYFDFIENNFEVKYEVKNSKFNSVKTKLVLETDIPVGFSAGYEITPVDLSGECRTRGTLELVEQDISIYRLNNNVLEENKSVVFDSFSNEGNNDGFYRDEFEFTIDFKSIDYDTATKNKCNGKAILNVGLLF